MKKENKDVMHAQSHAVRIEHIMRSVFDCDRSGMGGLVESSFIRKHPFTAIMSTIMYLCKRADSRDVDIASDFFEKFHFYSQWDIDELLSFENKTTEGCSCEIEYANGKEAIIAIIDAFSEVCTQLK